MKYLFEQKNINYVLYHSFLRFIKQLIHDDNVGVFEKYEAELLGIVQTPKERQLLSNFNILCWVQSEIKGIEMAKCLKVYNTKFS